MSIFCNQIGCLLRLTTLPVYMHHILKDMSRRLSVRTWLTASQYNNTLTVYKTQQASLCVNANDKQANSTTEVDDDFLHDDKYTELYTETYLLPSGGHNVFVIQPDSKLIPKRAKVTTADLQLSELCVLVETLSKWKVVDKAMYSLKVPHPKHVFGTGTISELTQRVRQYSSVTAVVMGVDMLSGLQLATLQQMFGVPVYDRYTIVLQIFKTRARTSEAKLQVALAAIPYYRSRLRGMHSGSLDQQSGGLSHIGGAGETHLELRLRLLHEREVKLHKRLDNLRSQREFLRKQRTRYEFPVVAVVGYTNTGKTSLIKALTGDSSMEPRDELFATLDVTAHRGVLPNNLPVLYIDTVGFISDIPTTLIQSFAATLEDITLADVIVHVRDVSHPDTMGQKLNVLQTLSRLQLSASLLDNMIEVCNKVDLLPDSHTDIPGTAPGSVLVSVTHGLGLADLHSLLQDRLLRATRRVTRHLRVPQNGPHLSWLYREASVQSTRADVTNSEMVLVDVVMTQPTYAKFISVFKPRTKQ